MKSHKQRDTGHHDHAMTVNDRLINDETDTVHKYLVTFDSTYKCLKNMGVRTLPV